MPATQLYDCDTHVTDHPAELWADLGLAPGETPEVVAYDGATRLRLHTRRLTDAAADPLTTFRTHFAVVPDPDEDHVRWAAEQHGRDSILFGSDYPHWDTVESDRWLEAFAGLCPPDALAANTARMVPRFTTGAAQ